jgi:hypothetical protein
MIVDLAIFAPRCVECGFLGFARIVLIWTLVGTRPVALAICRQESSPVVPTRESRIGYVGIGWGEQQLIRRVLEYLSHEGEH